jgi:hypothetical protein
MKDLGLKRTTFYKFANSYPKKLAMEYIDKHIKKGAEVSLEECCELIHIDIDVDTFKKYQEEYNNTVAILKSAKKREDIITARKRYTKMMNGE